jgi:hypothetical protein
MKLLSKICKVTVNGSRMYLYIASVFEFVISSGCKLQFDIEGVFFIIFPHQLTLISTPISAVALLYVGCMD